MTKRSYRLKKDAVKRYRANPALYKVGCDFDKETGKVSGVERTSF